MEEINYYKNGKLLKILSANNKNDHSLKILINIY